MALTQEEVRELGLEGKIQVGWRGIYPGQNGFYDCYERKVENLVLATGLCSIVKIPSGLKFDMPSHSDKADFTHYELKKVFSSSFSLFGTGIRAPLQDYEAYSLLLLRQETPLTPEEEKAADSIPF